MKKSLGQFLFTLLFTSFFLIFWIYFFVIPNDLKISLIFLVGVCLLIIGFVIFINLNHKKGTEAFLEFKICSENLIKIILLILFLTTLLISPVLGPKTVVLWSRLRILNYYKAVISLTVCAFLPGANVYNILFSNNKLSERLKIEPFLLKITIYPLLSLCFLGIFVFILDILMFTGDIIRIFSISVIILLSIFDFITQGIRKKGEFNLSNKIIISRNTGIILIYTFGILLIALGIQFTTQYLIIGDAWVGIGSATYIGQSNSNLFDKHRYFGHYPIFWGYIIYPLSVISGLPFVNINALLAPFCYLFITTTYLLMKAILYDFKEKYAVLSTIFMSCFSGLSYLFSGYSGEVGKYGIVALCEFYFIYKSFSFYLLILSLALFIGLIQSNENVKFNYIRILLKEDHKYLILTAIFLIISFMTYMIPLIVGVSFSFLFCFFSDNNLKSRNLRYFTILVFYLSILFLVFDTLMFNYLSWIITAQFEIFFELTLTSVNILENMSSEFLYSSILMGFTFLSFILQQLFRLLFEKEKISKFISKSIQMKKFELIIKVFLTVFSIFLIIEIGGILYEKIFGINDLSRNFFFFLFLDYLILYIGFIGIIGIYVSIYLFRKKPNLFFYLILCILFSFFLALIPLVRYFINNPQDVPKDMHSYLVNGYWFERIWFYSITSLCIFASYGLFKLVKTIRHRFFINTKKRYKSLMKHIVCTFFMFFLFSGLITAGMWYSSDRVRVKNNEILVIGWASENLPEDSRILIERGYNIERGLQTMTSCKIYYIDKEIDEAIVEADFNKTINNLKYEEIEYLLISTDFLSSSKNVSLFVKNYLIPNFYSEEVYENDDYLIYYSPYFD